MYSLLNIRSYLKKSLSRDQLIKLKKFQALKFRYIQYLIYRIFIGSNLKMLALVYNTDKWGTHWYAMHYENHFSKLRNRKLTILEIGVGGYNNPELGGGSLRMWRTYFPRSRIFGIDIYDKSPHNEKRIKTFKGSQVDQQFLDNVINEIISPDIIIDDGSHINSHVLFTFNYLFPKLKKDGIYVIEDVQTSYWEKFGGSSHELINENTIMGFFKGRIDGLNYNEFEKENYEPSYFDKNIESIHFYHNIVFVKKGFGNV